MRVLVAAVLALFLVPFTGLPAASETVFSTHGAGSAARPLPLDRNISLDIECHSGTPPVLELVLRDGGGRVRAAGFDFESDGVVDLRLPHVREGVVFRGVPYREKGSYRMTVTLETDRGVIERLFSVSFVDFVWGRDNFRFANDGPFENATDFVSKTVIEWAEDRFGELDTDHEMLVLYLMYSLYKGSIGRCYGFTGLQQFALERPDSIPPPYRSVYAIDERDEGVISGVDWLQNDMVFANFVSGSKALSGPVERATLDAELRAIKESITGGKPIIFGYVGNDLHHSMTVYGFFEDLDGGKTTLLAANNWIREQGNNVYSEDAENIVVDFSNGDAPLYWFDLTKQKTRYIERFFAIRREERYDLNRGDFVELLEDTSRRVVRQRRIIVLVENAGEAYIGSAPGARTGYLKGQTVRGLPGIFFKKIDYNYLFELPLDEPSVLVLNKRIFNKQKGAYKDVNLFAVIPTPSGFRSVAHTRVPVPFLSALTLSISGNGVALAKNPAGPEESLP